jgi:conjugal transfer/entry exclusion protein
MRQGLSLPRIQTALDKLEAQLSETHNQVKRVEELIRNTRTESNSRTEKATEDQNAKFMNLRTDLGAMRNDINSLKTGLSSRMDSIDKRITNLELSYKKLEETLRSA